MSDNLTNAASYKKFQEKLYNDHLLDDLAAGAGLYGFNKPKTVRDLYFENWFQKLNLKTGQKVLDIGSNAGANLEKLRRVYGIQGVGIDLSPETIKKGQKAFPELTLKIGDAENLDFPDNSFEKVISFEVFEHLPNGEKAIQEISRVLKPGGQALIYAISRRNALTWHWWQYKLTGGRFGTGSLRDHLPHLMVPPEEFKKWSNKAGLEIKEWDFFHSFFTILHDEVWTNFLAKTKSRIKNHPTSPRLRGASGSSIMQKSTNSKILNTKYIILNTSSVPLRPSKLFKLYRGWLMLIGFLLYALDTPWRLFRLSDGFIVLLKKN